MFSRFAILCRGAARAEAGRWESSYSGSWRQLIALEHKSSFQNRVTRLKWPAMLVMEEGGPNAMLRALDVVGR